MRLPEGGCQPLPGAQIDIWQCDAAGVYSDVEDPGFNTLDQKFLRGYQVTDARGEARFLTIYLVGIRSEPCIFTLGFELLRLSGEASSLRPSCTFPMN